MTDGRLTHATAQALTAGDPAARLTHATAQALTAGDPAARVTGSYLEVMSPGTSAAVLTAAYLEVMTSGFTHPEGEFEIEFTTGTWTDVSDWVNLTSGVTITRGRQNESGRIEPGTCSLTLANDSGDFSPGFATGAYYPNVEQGKRLRVSRQVDGLWHTRFTGYIETWGVGGWDASTNTAYATVTAVDTDGFMGEPLKTTAAEILQDAGAVAYWPLTESDSPASDALGEYPLLRLFQAGVDQGELSWGAGTGLPIDGVLGVVTVDNPDGTTGKALRSASGMTALPSSFTIGAWFPSFTTTLAGSRPLLAIQYGSRSWKLAWSPTTSKFTSTDTQGSSTSAVTSTAALTLPYMEMAAITTTGTTTRSGGTIAHTKTAMTGGTLYAGGAPGWLTSPGGAIGHVFILPSALTRAQMDDLAEQLEGTLAEPADRRIRTALGWVGESAAVAVVGGQTDVIQLPTSGVSVADLADTYAAGTGSRFCIGRTGMPTWIDRSYRPSAVEVSAHIVEPGMVYATDTSAYLSEGETTLPDGGSYTYRRTNPLKRQSTSITGVLPLDSDCRSALAWLVQSSQGGARIPNATIELLTLPVATRATEQASILSLDIGSRVTLTDLPAQIPDDQALIVEGYTETIALDQWRITFNMSPDPYGNVFIVEESLLDSGATWGP